MTFTLPQQAPAHEGFADLADVRLSYWDTGGDGEAVVMCHPASQSAEIWRHQQPALAAASWRVIAYSRRGYGRSEKGPADATGTSVGDLVDLLDCLDVDAAHVVGAAAGGITALAAAVGHPDRTLSVTLAGTIFSLNETAWREAFAHLGIAAVRDAVSTEFLELGPSYRFSNPEGTACFGTYSAAAHRQSPTRQASGVDVTWQALCELQCPALLVTGEADLYAPPPLQTMVAEHLANAETHTLGEIGHAAYWEAPDAFNALLLDFLDRHRSAGR